MAGDLFSLGCIFYYCVTGGRHPFGGILERDMNIWSNQVNLSFVKELIPEAHDLISHLLNPIPQWRPMASELCSHPFFWKSSKRLNFLCVFSDTLQENLRENSNPDLLMALESNKSSIFEWDWPSRLEFEFRVLISFGGQRSYSPYHARDLLKAIRDKWDKRQELPEPAEGLFRSECPVGAPLDECYDTYFARRFPNLLIEAYQVARYFCRGDPWFEAFKECED
ncbi:serine/threonine-protein kinase/endoribonuclease IRE1a-like [Rhodamnia argentea]|uniref:Serine/threonine-protein kinase/endoribonuclease IRE1a-like n=1 Tax=Rhodamnia argentea TaxID=178133 RepID=A0A8B8PMF1_9MYRT|nr:serine/threonine-protein kinase/endoribonuclease IRE1a-like [Rhodamnia argentea]